MQRTKSLLLAFLILYSGVLSASAQERNSITGFVFDESRRPLGQVYIELQTEFYATQSRARTQGSGLYTFHGLPAGRYYIKVLGVGTNYEEQSKAVSLIPSSIFQGRGMAHEQVDFYLKAKKLSNSVPASSQVVFAQEIPPEAKLLYEAGLVDLGKKLEVQGFDNLKRAIEIFPDYFAALDRLGNEYLNKGYYDAAQVLLTKSLAVNPRSLSSTLALGIAEFRLARADQALERFDQAVVLDRSSVNAHLWLGITLHGKNKFARSLTALLEANRLSGGNVPEIHWQLARVYKDQGKFLEAANALELFLKYRPDAQNAEEIRKVISSLRLKKNSSAN